MSYKATIHGQIALGLVVLAVLGASLFLLLPDFSERLRSSKSNCVS